MLRIGIDTGGTFTDFAVTDGSGLTTWKEPSTPDDPARAILAGLRRLVEGSARRRQADLVHGSTVATNALLERKTARIAYVGNEGFEDLLEIGRQARPDLYDLMGGKPEPLVPRDLRFGIRGRLRADGTQESPLDPEQITAVARGLRDLGIESAAVCLLHSYANDRHEEEVARRLAEAGLKVSVSSRLVREYREYERASTAAVNAAVAPVVARYLDHLETGLAGDGFGAVRVMGSNGGALSPRSAAEEAVRTVLSGPAAGVRAALHVGVAIGQPDVISFDMGGTSTDVCLIPGEARTTSDSIVAGHPVKVPAIDIHTVGAGGGSIAWRDPGGALRVGPHSAGADPGPACYGRGGPPTVTDANLLLGRIAPDRFLGGRMDLDLDAAGRAIAELGESLGMTKDQTAEGIVEIAEATMARAIRVISLFRGHEPGDFALMAFGGAGGLHAAALATALGMSRAIIPAEPGVFSAFGMTVADHLVDASATILADAREMTPERQGELFAPLERQCRERLAADGVEPARMRFERSADVRYRGQSFELDIPIVAGGEWIDSFHDRHEARYGYQRRDGDVEVVTLRVRGIGAIDPPPQVRVEERPGGIDAACVGEGEITWHGRRLRARRYDRARLPACAGGRGAGTLEGPALVLEPGATGFVPPGWRAHLDPLGHLHLGPGEDTP